MQERLERAALLIHNLAGGDYGPPELPSPLEHSRAELELAGVELAQQVRELVEFVPGEVSPIVLPRERLAGLDAALEAYATAGDAYVESAAAAALELAREADDE